MKWLGFKTIPTELIDSPELPVRLWLDEKFIKELGQDMKVRGQLQNIIVRKKGERYEVVVGHNRLLAAKNSGIKELHCLVVEAPDEEIMKMRLSENVMRSDMGAISQAINLVAIKERTGKTWRQIAADLPFSEDKIIKRVSLLQLPEEIQAQVELGNLAIDAALALLYYRSPKVDKIIEFEAKRTKRPKDQVVKELMLATAKRIIEDNLTVAQARSLVQHQLYYLDRERVEEEVETPKIPPIHELPKKACLICGQAYTLEKIAPRWICVECLGVAMRYMRTRRE